MIFRDRVSRIDDEDHLDSRVLTVLRERYGDAQPSPSVRERISDIVRSDLPCDRVIRLPAPSMLKRVWRRASDMNGTTDHSHCCANDLRLLLLRQHPMVTRLVC